MSRSVVGRAKAYSIKVNSEQSLLVGNDVGLMDVRWRDEGYESISGEARIFIY